MARSRKKINIGGISKCESEKKDKRHANRSIRRKNKIEVSMDKEILTEKREDSNIWSFGKDGKQTISDPTYLRK
ncbi:hypothetical protein [Rufibacter latericius]|uniref:Uncharacterized protein n=1 Tax=Rufibacter latericius TaxID=2487040 RepID=A0A3M9MN63_9BACT|nr:hypothetical protein [Rufibacter latericius]RNI26627.1 hypothetical protein EFB08_11455 [Rufibacter latericius]